MKKQLLWIGLWLMAVAAASYATYALTVNHLGDEHGYDLARDADQKRADHLQAVEMVHEGFHLGGVPHTHLQQIIPKKKPSSHHHPFQKGGL